MPVMMGEGISCQKLVRSAALLENTLCVSATLGGTAWMRLLQDKAQHQGSTCSEKT